MEAKWLSTRENLPEDGVPVLVCDNENNCWVAEYLREERMWIASPKGDIRNLQVRWWTPLPALPE